jgi:hypothetical protein
MRDNTAIHPLAAPNEKSGKIRFIHTDGKELFFASAVNSMTGDRISGFNSFDTIGHTVAEVRKIFAKIRAKATVLESIGDF